MKKLNKITIRIIFILFVVTVGILVMSSNDLIQIKVNKTSDASILQDKLVELSEWTTLKYDYSNVIISHTEKNLSILGITDVNYAETIKLIEYSGYLKAGTDLSKIKISYNESSKQLLVRVPKSKILDNVVDTDKTKVEDIKGNIFSDYPTQTIFDEINANKKQLEEEKIKQGFLEESDNRIYQLLTSFLAANGFNDVVIKFY